MAHLPDKLAPKVTCCSSGHRAARPSSAFYLDKRPPTLFIWTQICFEKVNDVLRHKKCNIRPIHQKIKVAIVAQHYIPTSCSVTGRALSGRWIVNLDDGSCGGTVPQYLPGIRDAAMSRLSTASGRLAVPPVPTCALHTVGCHRVLQQAAHLAISSRSHLSSSFSSSSHTPATDPP